MGSLILQKRHETFLNLFFYLQVDFAGNIQRVETRWIFQSYHFLLYKGKHMLWMVQFVHKQQVQNTAN